MKKIIVGFFALAFLVTAHSAFATGGWNTDPDDCQVPLAVGNYTTGVGIRNGPDGCWTLSSVTGSQGNTMNVRAYYDNTSGSPQTNVRVTLSPLNTGASSTFTFSGTVSSDQGNFNLGTVTINLSSPQTLTYGSTVWKKNDGTQTTFNGNQIINGGQNIGTVPSTVPSSPNLDGQGSLVVSFLVGTNNNTGICLDPNATNYNGPLPCNYYQQSNCYISNFTVNGQSTTIYLSQNQAANFAWNTNGFSYATLSGPNGTISNSLYGPVVVYPTSSGNYTLTASGNNCTSQSQSIYINMNNNQYNYCTISNFTANSSTNAYIQSGSPVNLVWNTNNCTSVLVSGPGITSNLFSGSQTIYPTLNTSYTITAYGYNGTTPSQTIYVTVNPNIIVQPPVYINSCAVTTVATNVGQNSATLNGLLSGSTGVSYFEYGTTVNLGSQTTSRTATGSYSDVISGLSPNTNYFFRFVSQCTGGLSYGKLEVFRTQGTGVVRPIIVQGTTVIGTESPIMLKIEDRYQAIGVGDTVDYTVTYKNIGKSKLTRPILQVIVPKGIIITNSSAGTYSTENNTLTVQLQDLNPGDEGVVYVQGIVNALDSDTAQVVTTAILVYTSPNGAQENAIAYVLNNPRGLLNNNLGAAAFFGGIFPSTLLGWLLLIILIMIIILITRRYSSKSVVQKTTPAGVHTTTTTNY